MIIVESPNKWSCVPAAFATAAGISLTNLLDVIGHDGSEIIFPDLPEPNCRRSFLHEEVALALLEFGWLSACYNFKPFGVSNVDHVVTLEYPKEAKDQILRTLLAKGPGVLCGVVKSTGNYHAAAWDGEGSCLDPVGCIYPISHYDIHLYYNLRPL